MPMYKLMDVGGLGLSTGGVPLLVALGGFMVLLPFIDKYKGDTPLERPAITAIGIFIILFFVIMAFWGYIQPGLSQTRLFTLIMFAGIAFVAFAATYAMKFARDDVIKNEIKSKTV
jgi:quinol-cytochrome oxidoreductase complex cytochrome b subunit